VIVAYDQSVRENAISNPAPIAGANMKNRSVESSILPLCCAALFRRRAPTNEAVISSSATTRVTIAQASAAKNADEKLIRAATFPNGIIDARCAGTTHRGNPGGCATPSPWAATINSPLSTSVTVGASVNVYRSSATRNTAPEQTSSTRDQEISLIFVSRNGFNAFSF
jgi:hypothetical protein